jgi:hypothetical protein
MNDKNFQAAAQQLFPDQSPAQTWAELTQKQQIMLQAALKTMARLHKTGAEVQELLIAGWPK